MVASVVEILGRRKVDAQRLVVPRIPFPREPVDPFSVSPGMNYSPRIPRWFRTSPGRRAPGEITTPACWGGTSKCRSLCGWVRTIKGKQRAHFIEIDRRRRCSDWDDAACRMPGSHGSVAAAGPGRLPADLGRSRRCTRRVPSTGRSSPIIEPAASCCQPVRGTGIGSSRWKRHQRGRTLDAAAGRPWASFRRPSGEVPPPQGRGL
jgi:hypothetical protein